MFFKVCNTLSSKERFFRDERLEEALFPEKAGTLFSGSGARGNNSLIFLELKADKRNESTPAEQKSALITQLAWLRECIHFRLGPSDEFP